MRKIWSSRQCVWSCSLSASARLEIGAEGLLDHEPAKAVGLVGETGLRDRLRGIGEDAGRQREVEDRGTVERRLQTRAATATEMSPPWNSMRSMNLSKYFLSTSHAVHVDRGAQVLVELIGRPFLARVADDLQILEPLAVLEREQRREQQPGREIARCAEHHERRLVAHAFFLGLTTGSSGSEQLPLRQATEGKVTGNDRQPERREPEGEDTGHRRSTCDTHAGQARDQRRLHRADLARRRRGRGNGTATRGRRWSRRATRRGRGTP